MRWLLLAVLGIAALLPEAVFAVNVSPSVADMVFMPGEQASLEFVVENTSTTAHTYTVSLYDVSFSAETNEPQFGPLSREHAAWIKFDTYDFSLAPAASRVVVLTVTVPSSAESNTHVFAPVIRESSAGDGILLSTGVSSLLFLTVGNPSTQAAITSFSAPPLSAHLPVNFKIEIANNGERVVQPYGIVRIRNIFGDEIASLDFNSEFRRVPSRVTREFGIQWGEEFAADGITQELWRELTAGVGLFTAELVAAPYPGAEPALRASTRFAIFPWRVAAIMCGLGVLGGFVIVRKRRRF